MKKLVIIFISMHLAFPMPAVYAQTPSPGNSGFTSAYMVQKEDSIGKAGNVYVTPTKKNEVLFKASIWGAVQSPGVHYMPLGTRLIDALSLAGGPLERANMDHITLTSRQAGVVNIEYLSLAKALENGENNPLLKPDDVLVISEDRSTERTQLWLQVGTFIMSAAALGLIVGNRH